MAGLLPDFSNELNDSKTDVLLQFSYDNTLEEIDGAMCTFQEKYTGKKHTIMLVAYSILTVAAIVLIIFDNKNILPYLALIFCVFNLYMNLTDRKRMRRKIIEAIKNTNPEDYTATIYDDKIEIDTVIMPKEDDEQVSEDDTNTTPIKSTFLFGVDMLELAENEDSILLIVARRQTYCFPKRCLTEEQQNKLRTILTEKTEM